MTCDWEALHNRLNVEDIIGCPLDPETSASVQQRWLEQYCSNVKAQTGDWIHLGFRWHAYSYGFEVAVSGDEARDLYRSKDQSTYLIYFESYGQLFDCVGPACPDLSGLKDDVYLFPADLSWTMIFTHEEGIGFGPFFAAPDLELCR